MDEQYIKVLLIEDDIVDRKAFQRFAKNEKLLYRYMIADSVTKAKKIIQDNEFDIVVSDFFLSDGDALEILDFVTETPVIIVTGTGDEDTAVNAMKKGAFDYLVKDSDNKYLTALTVRIDKAVKHKKTAEILAETQQRFNLAVEGSRDGLWYWHIQDENKHWWAPRFYEILGHGPNDFQSTVLDFGEILHPEDKEMAWNAVQATLNDDAPYDIKIRLRKKSGEYVWVRSRAQVQRDENGNAVSLQGSIQDLTEDIKQKELLKESEERYHDLFENASDLIQSVGMDGKFLFVNKAWKNTLGYSEEEVSKLTFLDIINDDDKQHYSEVFRKIKDGKENVDIEVSFVSKSGKKIIVEGKINTRKKDGKPFATRGIFRDITERKRAEKTLDTIIQVTSSKVGEEFLETLVSTLATTLRVKFGFITELISGDKISGKTVVYWKRGKIEENFEYDYGGTPCESVMEAGIAFYPIDVDNKFPDDLILKNEGIKSYLAIAFSDSSGQIKGHMGIMDTKPMERSDLAESMLKAFSARAGIELERKHTEEALRENQERLTGFMESATDIFALFDQNLNLVEVNKAANKILKRKKKDLIGKNFLELIPGIKESGRYKQYLKVLETGKPFFADELVSNPQLGNRFLSLKAFKVGEGLGIIITDITRLKETVNALKESKERIDSIVDNVADAIITIDENGIIESVNKATRKLFGYKRSELIGNNVKTLMPEKYKKKHDYSMKHYVSGGESQVIGKVIELAGRKKNGSLFPIDLAINEMLFDDKRMFTGIIRDITERKDAQIQIESKNEKLNQLIEELVSIDKLKSTFVSTVSHELRTPLTSIKASIGLVLAESVGEIDKEAKQFLKICYSNTDRLIRLINDLLDLSKLEEKTIKLSKRNFDIGSLVNEVIWALNSIAEFHSVSVVNEVKEDININADRDRIAQVLNNLMSNGIKFSGDGNVVNIQSRVRNGTVEITVADKGKPIPENIKEKIFERFFQADGTSSRKVGGTGLGLAISKSIIAQHGGEIWVESGKNKGNSFKFTLPSII